MPGAPDGELPIPVRRFQGTMLAIDSAFAPLGWLTHCEHWVPDLSRVASQRRLLSKRRGSAAWQRYPEVGRVDPLYYCTSVAGDRYLYAVVNDALYVSKNDEPSTAGSNGGFAAGAVEDLRYGVAVVADTLYVGNDVDPIKAVPLGGAATDLVGLALLGDTGQG